MIDSLIRWSNNNQTPSDHSALLHAVRRFHEREIKEPQMTYMWGKEAAHYVG